MALDQATAALLAQMVESGAKPMNEMTVAEARSVGVTLAGLYGPGPEVGSVENTLVPTDDGAKLPVRILRPEGTPRAVIVYYHGGGWVLGNIDENDTLGRQLAKRTGSTVVLVDFRLAPEHRYPTAVNDAYAALLWVSENLSDVAGEDVPIIVAGDSSGGNLAAVVSQRARDAGGPNIDMQVLVYPVTDCDFDRDSYRDPDNQLLLSRDSMIWFWEHYAPDEETRKSPDASPIRAADLSGLPPAVILTAEHDVVRDEAEAYAERLLQAGVPVQHRRFDGQMHVFFTLVNVLPGSAAGIDYVVDAIDQHLGA